MGLKQGDHPGLFEQTQSNHINSLKQKNATEWVREMSWEKFNSLVVAGLENRGRWLQANVIASRTEQSSVYSECENENLDPTTLLNSANNRNEQVMDLHQSLQKGTEHCQHFGFS